MALAEENIQSTFVLSVAALASCMAFETASAQSAQPASNVATRGDSSQTVTIAGRRETLLSDVPASITLISGEKLGSSLTRDSDIITMLESLVPGITPSGSVGFFNSAGTGTGPLLRGRPATVLINGVPVNALLRGNGVDLAQIDPQAIGSIEVQRGASSTFGFGASGGIISMETRRARSEEFKVTASTSVSANTKKPSGTEVVQGYLGGGRRLTESFDFYTGLAVTSQGQRNDSNGTPTPAVEAKSVNVDLNLGYKWGDAAELRASLNYLDRNYGQQWYSPFFLFSYSEDGSFDEGTFRVPAGINPARAYVDPSQESRENSQRALAFITSFTGRDMLGHDVKASFFYQRNKLNLAFFTWAGDAPPNDSYYIDANQLDNKRFGVRTTLTKDLALSAGRSFAVAYGIDLLRDQITRPFQSGGGEQVSTFVPGFGPITYSRALDVQNPVAPPVRLDSLAAFVEASHAIGTVTVRGGLRAERYKPTSLGYADGGFVYAKSDAKRFDATLLNLGVVWQSSPSNQLYVGVSQGIEMTPLAEALRQLGRRNRPVTADDVARLELVPAKTTEFEIGTRGRFGRSAFTAAAYYSRAPLSSQLQVDPQSPTGILIPSREPQRTWGIEVTVDQQLSGGSTVGAILSYAEGRRKLAEDESWSPQPNNRIAAPRIGLNGDFKIGKSLSLQADAQYTFARRKYPARAPIPFGYNEQLGNSAGHFVIDAGIRYQLGKGELAFGVGNLLNKRYFDGGGNTFDDLYEAYAEGRRVKLTYRIEL